MYSVIKSRIVNFKMNLESESSSSKYNYPTNINEKTDEIFGYILCSQIEAAKAVNHIENEVDEINKIFIVFNYFYLNLNKIQV